MPSEEKSKIDILHMIELPVIQIKEHKNQRQALKEVKKIIKIMVVDTVKGLSGEC